MGYLPRDFYWKQIGWRWQVWTARNDGHERVGEFSFWSWRTAAQVATALFQAYHDGRDAERNTDP